MAVLTIYILPFLLCVFSFYAVPAENNAKVLKVIGLMKSHQTNSSALLNDTAESLFHVWNGTYGDVNVTLTLELIAVEDSANGSIMEYLQQKTDNFSNVVAFISYLDQNSELMDKLLNTTLPDGIPVLDNYPDENRTERHASLVSVNLPAGVTSKTILDIISHLKWTYVQAVYQSTTYFTDVLEQLNKMFSAADVCILKNYEILQNHTELQIIKVIQTLEKERQTSGVLLFLEPDMLRQFSRVLAAHPISVKFHFITVDILHEDNFSMLGTISVTRDMDLQPFSDIGSDAKSSIFAMPLRFLLSGFRTVLTEDESCLSYNETAEFTTCIRASLLENFGHNLAAVYNYQAEKDNIILEKTMIVSEEQLHLISQIQFYDKDGILSKSPVKSTCEPYRWECRKSSLQDIYISGPADVYLLGVFPVHMKDETPSGCGRLDPHQAVLTEAVAFGLDIINNNPAILHGISLGYVVVDSCSVPERTLAQLDEIYSNYAERKVTSSIFGAVGFSRDEEYRPIAGYLSSKQLLTISAMASSPDFSNKELYPAFMHMVPPTTEEVGVIFRILEHFGIVNIGVIYSDTEHNTDNAKIAMKTAKTFGVSILYAFCVTEKIRSRDEYMDYLIEAFISRNMIHTKTVVAFTEAQDTLSILKAMKRQQLENILWIGSDKWYTDLPISDILPYSDLVKDALVLGVKSRTVPSFLRHLQHIEDGDITKNIFLKELNTTLNKCEDYLNISDINDCDRIRALYTEFFFHNQAHLVIDSITAFAQGLREVLSRDCPNGDFCQAAKINLPFKLRENIFTNQFEGILGNKITFDSKGNGPAAFDIHVLEETKTNFIYKTVGSFADGKLSISGNLNIPDHVLKTDCIQTQCPNLPSDILSTPSIYIAGDLMIYGFVQLYEKGEGETCSLNIFVKGYQSVEMLLWSIDKINNDTELLPDMSVGLAIFPTCGISKLTADLVQSVLLPTFILNKNGNLNFNATLLGIVGGENAQDAFGLETGTRRVDNDVPVIVASGAPINSDKADPRVFRTTLSTFEEMDFVVALCRQLQWSYVHVLSNKLMDYLADYLEDKAKSNNICFATRQSFSGSILTEDARSLLMNMSIVEGASAVILLVSSQDVLTVLKAANDLNLAGKLFFIDPFEDIEIENQLKDVGATALGLLTTKKHIPTNDHFMQDFLQLDLHHRSNNPWFSSFWEQTNQCNLELSTFYEKDCISSDHLRDTDIQPTSESAAILNSVYALVYGMDDFLNQCEKQNDICMQGNRSQFYSQLETYLSKTKFTPPGGTPFMFRDKYATTALVIKNLQNSPDDSIRFVDIGRFVNSKLTLDMRKLSFYRYGERIIPESKCPGVCTACMDPIFVRAYEERIQLLISAGPVMENNVLAALGVVTILLIIISLIFIVIAFYYFCQFYTHKSFGVNADADVAILIGATLLACSSVCHLFTHTKLTCTVQLGTPALSYTMCIVALIVKISKSVCLRESLGQRQNRLPRWDFGLTYVPLFLVPGMVSYVSWIMSDSVSLTASVTDIQGIGSINEITVTWECEFNRLSYVIYMTPFWFVNFELFVITLSYRLRYSNQVEAKHVMWSSVITLIFIGLSTLVLMLTANVDVYGTIMCFLLNINSMVFVCSNFIPKIMILMTEEQKERHFASFLMEQKVSKLAKHWHKDTLSKRISTAKESREMDSIDKNRSTATTKANQSWKNIASKQKRKTYTASDS